MNSLQSVSIVAAFPIGIVIVMIAVSFLKDAKLYLEELQGGKAHGRGEKRESLKLTAFLFSACGIHFCDAAKGVLRTKMRMLHCRRGDIKPMEPQQDESGIDTYGAMKAMSSAERSIIVYGSGESCEKKRCWLEMNGYPLKDLKNKKGYL